MFDALLVCRNALLKNGTSLGRYIPDYIVKGGYPALLDADLVVTKNTLRLDGDILFVPLPLFLAVC